MKRRSRPPTLTSIRRACQWLGRCGCALRACGDTGMRISASPRASCWTISWRRLSARASTSGAAYPQPASPTRTLAESTLGQTGSRRILAAQLRCQAQFAAVHGAELGIKHPWLCVSIRQVARICGQGERPCWLPQLPSSTRFSGVSGNDQTTPSTASTRSGWRTFTAGRLQAWVSGKSEQLGQRLLAQALAGLHADTRCGQRLSIQAQIQLLHPPATVAGRETAPVRSQPHGMLGRQLAPADGGLPLVPSACAIQAGSINALSCSRRSGYWGRVWRKAFASRLIGKKGTC